MESIEKSSDQIENYVALLIEAITLMKTQA